MEDGGERGVMMMEIGDEGPGELDCQENDDEVEKTEGGATRDEGRRERK